MTQIDFNINDVQAVKGNRLAFKVDNNLRQLSMFDQTIITLSNSYEDIVIFDDFACEAFRSFYEALKQCINGDLELNKDYTSKSLGYYWNIYNYLVYQGKDTSKLDCLSQYHLWSTSSQYAYDTWIYSKKGSMFLEISKTFDFYATDSVDYHYHDLLNYLSHYKADDIIKIDPSDAKNWLNKLYKIISSLQD